MGVRLKQSALPSAAFLACGALTWWITGDPPVPDLEPTEVPGLYVRRHVVDVGLLANGEERTAIFEFVNRGAAPVTIGEVIETCACTVAQLDGQTILPGETVPLRATVRRNGLPRRRGTGNALFERRLSVRIDRRGNPERPEILLLVRGEVDSDSSLRALPGVLDFGTIAPGVRTKRAIRFEGVQSVLEAIPDEVTIDPAQQTVLSVRPKGTESDLSAKTVTFSVERHTFAEGVLKSPGVLLTVEGPSPERLLVPVRGRFGGAVVATPRRLYLNAVEGQPAPVVDLTLNSPGGGRPAVAQITSDLPLDWELLEETGSEELVVRVSVQPTAASDRLLSGSLTVELQAPQARIEVPVAVVVSDR